MKVMNVLLLLLSIFIILGCNQSSEIEEGAMKDYVLVLDDDNILVEKFDSTNVDENKYNRNNIVYKPGAVFTYAYQHITPDGEVRFFKLSQDFKRWEFVGPDASDSTTIKSVDIEVFGGNPMSQFVPDYNQTALAYKLKDNIPFSMSGAIENEANVWIHPPRDHYFEILELNPFPYIKAPYKVGTEWTWDLRIGSKYADERWATWEGVIENKYQYKIVDIVQLATSLGKLECYVIESKAKSSLGETGLTAYYNEKYGFVKLDYSNINGSKTMMELTEYSGSNIGGADLEVEVNVE